MIDEDLVILLEFTNRIRKIIMVYEKKLQKKQGILPITKYINFVKSLLDLSQSLEQLENYIQKNS